MKKLIASVLIAFMAMTTIHSFAQNIARADKKEVRKENEMQKKSARKALHKVDGTEVSQLSKDAFYSDFGKVGDVSWGRKTQFDEATFVNKGVKNVAYYDYNNKLVGTSVGKKYSDLPAVAQQKIDKEYRNAGYKIGDVTMFDDNEANDSNMFLHGVQSDGADHYFVSVFKDGKETVLQVDPDNGDVSYFKEVR